MSLHICIHICMYLYMCIFACTDVICVNMYTYTCLPTYIPKSIHWYGIYAYTYMHSYIHIDTDMCNMGTYVPTCTHMPIHGYLHTCMNICIYIYNIYAIYVILSISWAKSQWTFLFMPCTEPLILIWGVGHSQFGLELPVLLGVGSFFR